MPKNLRRIEMSRGGHQCNAWYKRSDRQLRANPLCLCCSAVGIVRPAELSDHIVPVSNGGDLLRGGLQSACKSCHDGVKRKLEQLYRQGKCNVEDLRLDSKMAQQLRRQQRGMMRYEVTGKPLFEDEPLASPLSGSTE
jgi:hypothetical protein